MLFRSRRTGGEVSLIFVAVGATLALPGGQGAVVGAATFGAVVIMVAVTTLITPPALKWSLRAKRNATTVN